MRYFLVTAGHHTGEIWFRERGDFIVAMNYVAVLAATMGVTILSFVLMSNHVHFVVCCECKDDAEEFIVALKQKYSAYLQRKYGCKEFLRGEDVNIRDVEDGNESLERAIAYVQMNPIAANICQSPPLFPWGTGPAFFTTERRTGKSLSTMSTRQQRLLTKSKIELPAEYITCSEGYILPESYVPVSFVEELFQTPKRYNYFLSSSSKVKDRNAEPPSGIPFFSDQVIRAGAEDLCHSMYQVSGITDLDSSQLSQLMHQLRRRFSAETEQLARVTGIKPAKIATMLDSF